MGAAVCIARVRFEISKATPLLLRLLAAADNSSNAGITNYSSAVPIQIPQNVIPILAWPFW